MTKKQIINVLLKKVSLEIQLRNVLNHIVGKYKGHVHQIIDVSLLIDDCSNRNPDTKIYGEEVVVVTFTLKKNRNCPLSYIKPLYFIIPVRWLDHNFDIESITIKSGGF